MTTVRIHRASLAVFVVGMLALIAGAFAVGVSIARPADAASGFQTVKLGYLAPVRNQSGTSVNCGRLADSGATSFTYVGNLGDYHVIMCETYLKVAK